MREGKDGERRLPIRLFRTGWTCNNVRKNCCMENKENKLAKMYGKMSMADKTEMETIADCQEVTERKLMTAWNFTARLARRNLRSACRESLESIIKSSSVP